MVPKKLFWPMAIFIVVLFTGGLCEAHDTHLSGVGEQTNVSVEPCPTLGGYLVQSDQQACYVIYKYTDLVHSKLHVQPIKLNSNGECACPGEDDSE